MVELCDFCNERLPVGVSRWIYDLGSVASLSAGPSGMVSDGLWAACRECHGLIVQGNRRRLALRAVPRLKASGQLPKGVDQGEVLELVVLMQEALFWLPLAKVVDFAAPLEQWS